MSPLRLASRIVVTACLYDDNVPIRDIAIYVNGQRIEPPGAGSLALTHETLRHHDGVLWVQLDHPTSAEIQDLADVLGIHDLVVEDAINAHQRNKMERYGEMLYVVLHAVEYHDAEEKLEYGEIHVLVGRDFVVSIRWSDLPDLKDVVSRIEVDQADDPQLIGMGSLEILHAILDEVMEGYRPVIRYLEDDIDEAEDQIFTREEQVSQRIYELSREIIIFQRATKSLVEIARALADGSVFDVGPGDLTDSDLPGSDDPELARHWRDVLDHALAVAERADEYRSVVENAMKIHATLVELDQNEEMSRMTQTTIDQAEVAKKIAGWAGILFFPTMVASIYGMNFPDMPELGWSFGYLYSLALMLVGTLALYFLFKKIHWI